MPIDREELRRLDEAATKGPWRTTGAPDHYVIAEDIVARVNKTGVGGKPWGKRSLQQVTADASLIAYLRNHVGELLEALADKARLDKLEGLAEFSAWKNKAEGVSFVINDDPKTIRSEKTLRAAIDAAVEGR